MNEHINNKPRNEELLSLKLENTTNSLNPNGTLLTYNANMITFLFVRHTY